MLDGTRQSGSKHHRVGNCDHSTNTRRRVQSTGIVRKICLSVRYRGVIVCLWLFVFVVLLSRFRRLSGVGVVLTSLALDLCSGMVGDGFQTQKTGSWILGKERAERVLASVISIDGRKEWKCKFCSEEKKEKEGRKRHSRPRASQVLGKSGRWLFLFVLFGQKCLCVNAAAKGLQRRTEMMQRMQQLEVQVKESRWMEETPQTRRQLKGADRTEMRKEEKRLKCTLLNRSAWSTEKKT